jgi:uncharacterized protein (DUF1330 family)
MARVVVVAILTVRQSALEAFRAYERHAAAVMAAHGGRIARTVVVIDGAPPGTLQEIHLLEFPHRQGFADYRDDPRLGEMRRLREQSVVHTEVLVGEAGPDYGA